jgi:hypothetical protein
VIHGLREEVLGPGKEPAHPRIVTVEGADDDDGNVLGGGSVLEPARHLVPVQARHHHVEQDEVERFPLHDGERILAALRGEQLKAVRHQHRLEQSPVAKLIVHDQDPCDVVEVAGECAHTPTS